MNIEEIETGLHEIRDAAKKCIEEIWPDGDRESAKYYARRVSRIANDLISTIENKKEKEQN